MSSYNPFGTDPMSALVTGWGFDPTQMSNQFSQFNNVPLQLGGYNPGLGVNTATGAPNLNYRPNGLLPPGRPAPGQGTPGTPGNPLPGQVAQQKAMGGNPANTAMNALGLSPMGSAQGVPGTSLNTTTPSTTSPSSSATYPQGYSSWFSGNPLVTNGPSANTSPAAYAASINNAYPQATGVSPGGNQNAGWTSPAQTDWAAMAQPWMPGGSQSQTAAQPSAASPSATSTRQAYLNALSNPGPQATYGATVPQSAPPGMTRTALTPFLQSGQQGGAGPGGFTNQPFFSNLRALAQGQPPVIQGQTR